MNHGIFAHNFCTALVFISVICYSFFHSSFRTPPLDFTRIFSFTFISIIVANSCPNRPCCFPVLIFHNLWCSEERIFRLNFGVLNVLCLQFLLSHHLIVPQQWFANCHVFRSFTWLALLNERIRLFWILPLVQFAECNNLSPCRDAACSLQWRWSSCSLWRSPVCHQAQSGDARTPLHPAAVWGEGAGLHICTYAGLGKDSRSTKLFLFYLGTSIYKGALFPGVM